ncbi:MAG: lipoprotein-releasing ABC transporter permease subunit [Nitrospinae bacterium]|nr:lipoprotein-releasing ABC transporter permease subunit [Nitrospinota bacterium]
MFSYFELFTAYRFLKSKRRERFISLISFISMAGISVGVISLIIVISVMKGFQNNLKDRILGMNAHILVQDASQGLIEDYASVIKKIMTVKGTTAASPFVYGQVIVASRNRVSGVVVNGILPLEEKNVSKIVEFMTHGSLDDLEEYYQKGKKGVIIGNELANTLKIKAGNDISIITPSGRITPLGMVPHLQKFKVIGTFESGMYDYDSNMILIHLNEAKKFFRLGNKVNGIAVRTQHIDMAEEVAKEISKTLDFPYLARDWISLNKNLFAALKLEQIAMFIILTLIIIVAAFNIISTLLMTIMEKQSSIAILKAMGARREQIMKIFMIDGFAIGAIGTFWGAVIGTTACYILKTYPFIKLPKDVYQMDTLPVDMEIQSIILIIVAALLISFISTIYPSWNASRMEPVEALRYE